MQLDELALRAAEQRIGAVVFVIRLEDDHFVAGIGDGQQRRDHAFGGAAADGDFALGIEFEAVVSRGIWRRWRRETASRPR